MGENAFDAHLTEMSSPRYFHGELEHLIREVFANAQIKD